MLVGVVDSDASRSQAERVVTGVAGVLSVTNRLEVPASELAPLPPHLEIRSQPEGVTLRGTLPTEARREELLARARELYGADRVDARLAVDPGVADGAAVAGAGDVLAVLAGHRQAVEARLDGDGLRLSGTVSSAEARKRIEEQAQAAAPRVRLFFSALAVATPAQRAGPIPEAEGVE